MTEYVVSWFNGNDGEDEDDEMTLRVDVFCESEDADKAKSHAQELLYMADINLSDFMYDYTNEA